MSILSFNNFISKNPKYKKFETSTNARNVYEFLSEAESIEKMISANTNSKPALFGVQSYLETKFAGHSDFNFTEGFAKQCVGSMVRTVLEPFGYKPLLQRDLPKKTSLYFTSAMHYEFNEADARLKLVKKVHIEDNI
jgi:hypothetical protein